MRRTRFRIVLEQNNVPRLSEDLIGTPQYEAAVRAMIAYEQAVSERPVCSQSSFTGIRRLS